MSGRPQPARAAGAALTSLPFVAFFLSGASSLVFQTLWTRLLHHVFGATSVAMSSVLTVFMAGLGFGAYAMGRWGGRIRKPLLAYAGAELVIGLCGLVIPLLVQSDGWLAELNAWLRHSLGAGSTAFMLARFAAVVPLLLLPTSLMGATLPLLARHLVEASHDPDRVGARVGTLYAVNTLGAVFGTVMAAFVLMPSLGVWRTNLVAASANVVLGVGIWLLRDRMGLPDAPAPDSPSKTPDAPAADANLPTWVRRVVVFAFGLSGACALGYEVVWSRALAMAIGSSLHSFALILTTFLVGIALGSAAISPLLSRPAEPASGSLVATLRARPGLRVSAFAAVLLVPLAHADLAVRAGPWQFVAALLVSFAAIALAIASGARQIRDAALLEASGQAPTLMGNALFCLAVPWAGGVLHAVAALTARSRYAAVTVHGYLPYITATVVTLVAVFVALILMARRRLVLVAALLQVYVALATFGSYLIQDEIPYTFARLVSSLSDLPEHVATVRFFMFFTAAMCTLPATLGMGAMFPLTLRVWSSGGDRAAADVGTVYATNTLGSLVGAWLPGFVLMPRIGMQTTLLLGMTLNLVAGLALAVLSDLRRVRPPGASRWPQHLLAAATAPLWAVLLLAVQGQNSPVRWNLAHMTLGAFRVSLADNVLDPQSWGEPDIPYYRDGVSTTVSIERWGGHVSLKNNGKVDASNGDDMPTQIMVAAYPLLLHPDGPEGLDVALVGFGSGVTVGAALQFPLARLDVVELEESVVEAAADYFHEVNHLPRTRDDFPYVSHEALHVHADDGRNFLAASRRQYDVIISEPSNPWITGVSDLFTVEHFETSKRRLVEGGVYCQWVQLYEISPENIKIIYRTFAQHFEHMAVFSAAHGSSDTILVGSDRPLPMDLGHVRRAMEKHPAVAKELARAHVHRPHDAFARALFATRDELLAYTQIEERRLDGRWQPPLAQFPRVPSRDGSGRAPLNTDDNMRIELAAPRDLIGYGAYSGYMGRFYAGDWPYGDLLDHLRPDPGDDAAMALSLATHGRRRRAVRFAERSVRAADTPEGQHAKALLAALAAPPSEWPAPFIAPPEPGPQMDRATGRHMQDRYAAALAGLAAGQHAAALEALEGIPTLLLQRSGPALRLLHGYLLLRAGADDRSLLRPALSELDALVRDAPAFVGAHPETLFFVARAQSALRLHADAVATMASYLEALAPRADARAPADGGDTPPERTDGGGDQLDRGAHTD